MFNCKLYSVNSFVLLDLQGFLFIDEYGEVIVTFPINWGEVLDGWFGRFYREATSFEFGKEGITFQTELEEEADGLLERANLICPLIYGKPPLGLEKSILISSKPEEEFRMEY